MKKEGGDPGPDYDAHHKFPQKFRDFFEAAGIDIDAPENGEWVDLHEHRSGASSYNDLWQNQINIWNNSGGATKQDIFDFMDSLERTY